MIFLLIDSNFSTLQLSVIFAITVCCEVYSSLADWSLDSPVQSMRKISVADTERNLDQKTLSSLRFTPKKVPNEWHVVTCENRTHNEKSYVPEQKNPFPLSLFRGPRCSYEFDLRERFLISYMTFLRMPKWYCPGHEHDEEE